MTRRGRAAGRSAERAAKDSTWLDRVAVAGLLAYGTVHLMVAWLVLRLAFGDPAGSASGTGAFRQLAHDLPGRVLLCAVATGFLALALWQGIEAVLGYHRDATTRRVALRVLSGVKAVVFLAIGVNAWRIALGAGSSSSGTDGPTARLMSLPAGPLVVAAVGVVIVVVGLVLVYYGLAENFRDFMTRGGSTGHVGRFYVLLGMVGHVSRGVAVVLVGLLFGYAAVTHDPQKAGGLDSALREVLTQPFGAPALVVVALGLAAFGLFCFAWSRHLDR